MERVFSWKSTKEKTTLQTLVHLTLNHDDNAARVSLITVLKEKEALPGSQGHLAVDHRNDFTGASENHANVRGHVIWPFIGVTEVGRIFRDELVETGVQYSARALVGILHDHEPGAGVLQEDGHAAGPRP